MPIDKFGRYLCSDNRIGRNSSVDISSLVNKDYLHKKLNDLTNTSNEILQKTLPPDISNLIEQISILDDVIKTIQEQNEKKIGDMDKTIKTMEEQEKKQPKQQTNQALIKGLLIFTFGGTLSSQQFNEKTLYTFPTLGVAEYIFPLKKAKIIKVVADDGAYLVINKTEFSANRLVGHTLVENDKIFLTAEYAMSKNVINFEIIVEYSHLLY